MEWSQLSGAADALLAQLPPSPSFDRIVEKTRHGRGEFVDVVAPGVTCRTAGRNACLMKVERHDRQTDGHVLQDLVHGGDVVEWIVGIRCQCDVCGRKAGEQALIRDAPGERDVALQSKLAGKVLHFLETVPRADERGMPVVVSDVSKRGERTERVVDAVLWAHDAEITKQVLFALLQCGVRDAPHKPAHVRRASDHEHSPRVLAAAVEGNLPVAPVRRNDDVGKPVGETLGGDHASVQKIPAAAEPGEVELGHQVMLVEDQPGASQLERQRDGEQQVGRVADVDDVETAQPASQPPRAP